MDLKEADSVVHFVEKEWHYNIMTQYGYQPLEKTKTGLVRRYTYVHPVTKHEMKLVTGYSGDYWDDPTNKRGGYFSTLEEHLAKLQ